MAIIEVSTVPNPEAEDTLVFKGESQRVEDTSILLIKKKDPKIIMDMVFKPLSHNTRVAGPSGSRELEQPPSKFQAGWEG